jgi:hypothetical protein
MSMKKNVRYLASLFFRKNSTVSLSAAALVISLVLSCAFHWSFLTNPYWMVLDDASHAMRYFSKLIESPNLGTLASLDQGRCRMTYLVISSALFAMWSDNALLFWLANCTLLVGCLFMSYAIAGLFTRSRWIALLTPIVFFFLPPIVANFCELQTVEPYQVFFSGFWVYFLIKTDRLLENNASLAEILLSATLCWLNAALFMFSKEQATAGIAFPVGWIILGLLRTTKGSVPKRLVFLVSTFIWMAFLALLVTLRIRGAISGEVDGLYLNNYALDVEAMLRSHNAFMTMLLPRIWPILLIPAAVFALAAVTTRKQNIDARLAYVRPFLFFTGMTLIQYGVILPWEPMVKNLLAASFPLAIVNAVSIDWLVAMEKETRKQRPA